MVVAAQPPRPRREPAATVSEVDEVEGRDGWTFAWNSHGGRFELEWLPNKEQWQRSFRSGNVGAWSMQPMDHLETPYDHADAKRIALEHASGML